LVCKDFLKGQCERRTTGSFRCKFRHDGDDAPLKVPFCKDFVSKEGCHYQEKQGRECSYMHAKKWTVYEYEVTGWLPEDVVKEVADRFKLCFDNLKAACARTDGCRFSHTTCSIDLRTSRDKQPRQMVGEGFDAIIKKYGLCKDYVTNKCRFTDCRFKHREPQDLNLGNPATTWAEVRDREDSLAGQEVPMSSGRRTNLKRQAESWPMGGMSGMDMEVKRMRMEAQGMGGMSGMSEIEMLRMENAQLRQKVLELTATNKFLLEQNALNHNSNAGRARSPGFDSFNRGDSLQGQGFSPKHHQGDFPSWDNSRGMTGRVGDKNHWQN